MEFELLSLIRPNIKTLSAYSSARSEFAGKASVYLDANENPFGSLNRYPDPNQTHLKSLLAEAKGIPVSHIFIGNGSDEVIDTLFRVFCEPGTDQILLFPPTYGMYEVSAHIHNVGIMHLPLTKDFQLPPEAFDPTLNHKAKMAFLCSPNNPTGNTLTEAEAFIKQFKGIVVLDEAYIDFSSQPSFLSLLHRYPNLVISQTFSKARGLASIRIGMAFASPEIIHYMNKVKPPYNVSELNQQAAIRSLSHQSEMVVNEVQGIKAERNMLIEKLKEFPFVHQVYATDANFILVKVSDANRLYDYLVSQGIIIRNRNTQVAGCIRITVGTPQENQQLLAALTNFAA